MKCKGLKKGGLPCERNVKSGCCRDHRDQKRCDDMSAVPVIPPSPVQPPVVPPSPVAPDVPPVVPVVPVIAVPSSVNKRIGLCKGKKANGEFCNRKIANGCCQDHKDQAVCSPKKVTFVNVPPAVPVVVAPVAVKTSAAVVKKSNPKAAFVPVKDPIDLPPPHIPFLGKTKSLLLRNDKLKREKLENLYTYESPWSERKQFSHGPGVCQFLDKVEEFASGSYGNVYRAVSGTHAIAVKKYIKKNFSEFVDVDIASRVRHPMLANLYTVMTPLVCKIFKTTIVSVMDYYQYTLNKVIDDSIEVNKSWLGTCLIQAVNFLHRNSILHLDIKPDNVLIEMPNSENPTGKAVLADFGLAEYLTLGETEVHRGLGHGTLPFIKPSCFDPPYVYNWESDIWALGMTIAGLFLGLDVNLEINKVTKGNVKKFKKANADFASKMLSRLPPGVFKYMIGARLKPAQFIIDKYTIPEIKGTVVVETAEDLDPRYIDNYNKALNLAKKIRVPDLFYLTIHLVYVSFKALITLPGEDRVKYCEHIACKMLNYDTRDIHVQKYLDFRNALLKYTNGALRTFNAGDISDDTSSSDMRICDDPLTYFSNLAKNII
jgi:serine/threonine protein kinase